MSVEAKVKMEKAERANMVTLGWGGENGGKC
jgi:hypothetical protein